MTTSFAGAKVDRTDDACKKNIVFAFDRQTLLSEESMNLLMLYCYGGMVMLSCKNLALYPARSMVILLKLKRKFTCICQQKD